MQLLPFPKWVYNLIKEKKKGGRLVVVSLAIRDDIASGVYKVKKV